MSHVRISIYRHDPFDSHRGGYVEYEVPFEEGMSVLDAVNHVSKYIDPTLSVRWNCKAARCGSCSAEINNMPRLMCKTKVEGLGGKISVAPMKAFPLVKDLVTDVSANYETIRKISPFKPKSGLPKPWIMRDMDVQRSKEFRKCIECFLCQDTCHVVRGHGTNYVGPRHVIKAASLDMHPLDTLDRSRELAERHGLGYCNVTKCCQEVCPEHIRITDNAIIPEKERNADLAYDPILWASRKIKEAMGRRDGANGKD